MHPLTRCITALTLAALAMATTQVMAENFTPHSKRASLTIGTGNAFGDSYTIVGAGGGYYFAQGFEAGLDANLWFGGDSDIYEVTPSLNYVVTQMEHFHPYAGVLYRKTFIEDYDDLSAWGGRAGVIWETSGSAYMRAGLVYVAYQDCSNTIFRECSEVYPEFSAGVSF